MGVYKSLRSKGDNTRSVSTYTHPGVVCSDVIEVPSHLVLLLVQIVKCLYCLLKAIMARGERKIKYIRDKIGWRVTWEE
jgi:hypothetical protein